MSQVLTARRQRGPYSSVVVLREAGAIAQLRQVKSAPRQNRKQRRRR